MRIWVNKASGCSAIGATNCSISCSENVLPAGAVDDGAADACGGDEDAAGACAGADVHTARKRLSPFAERPFPFFTASSLPKKTKSPNDRQVRRFCFDFLKIAFCASR